jgi:hypothetical protein
MNRVRSSLWLALAVLAGCGGSTPSGFSGEWSAGELDHSLFQLSDALCPGLSGGCNLTTMVAAGSTPDINVDVPDAEIDDLTVVASGPLTIDIQENDGLEILLETTTTGPGTATLEVQRGDGTIADRASFEVEEPAGLLCGQAPEEGVEYTALGIEETDTLALQLPTDTDAGTRQILCRVLGSRDQALLAVGVIDWEVTAGAEAVAIRASALGLGGTRARAARIFVTPLAVGEATVVGTMPVAGGGVETRTFTVTVTE